LRIANRRQRLRGIRPVIRIVIRLPVGVRVRLHALIGRWWTGRIGIVRWWWIAGGRWLRRKVLRGGTADRTGKSKADHNKADAGAQDIVSP